MPPWRERFAGVAGAILADTSACSLFSETGLPTDRGFLGEAATRWARHWLPAPPDDADVAALLARLSPRARDRAWLAEVSPGLVVRLAAAVRTTEADPWLPARRAAADAIALLATRVAALGLAADIRVRSPACSLLESPFYRLPRAADAVIAAIASGDGEAARAASAACEGVDGECRRIVYAVFDALERSGVSVDVVYRLDVIARSLDRLDHLLALIRPEPDLEKCRRVMTLLAELLESRHSDLSILALLRGNMRLLARKIIERAGHTGEHYITTSRGEYVKMLASAGGGGVLTAGTAALKYIIGWAKLPFFVEGVLSAANYAGSFLVMQLAGFTLATKQPSMTAAALAGALRESASGQPLDGLVTQIARITRSQLAAAIGNIGLVIPAAYGLDLFFRGQAGRSFLDAETARYVIRSLHPTESGTIFFAILTGVFLWASSVAAGWLENWAVYERLPEGIAHHSVRRLIGARATAWMSRAFSRNVSGLGGNVTLGALLGMTPVIGKFVGLPLDVRHVTLSTGALVLAACALGEASLDGPELGWAALGIAIVGVLNFGVSFVLALAVALRARDVDRSDRLRLLLAVLRRLVTSPLEFVFPPRG